jgi:L-ascorbate metabolism protein UlaG (beta-lactamase superfamily)
MMPPRAGLSPRKLAVMLIAVTATVGTVVASRVFSSPSLAPYESLWMSPAEGKPPGLSAQFFGISTILVSDGTTSLMVDGYFSRPEWWKLLFYGIAPDEKRIDHALCRGHVRNLAAVLVAHSHYDHALDSATVAKRYGQALLVGSASTAKIARGQCFPKGRVRIVDHGDKLKFGDFEVTFFESPHSPDPIAPGSIDEPLRTPATFLAYKDGLSYAYLLDHKTLGRVLIVPSANYRPGLFRGVEAHTVFLSIGTLGKQSEDFTRRYWKEVVGTVHPQLVVPIHWDHPGRPLTEPLRATPYLKDDMTRSMTRLRAMAKAEGVRLELMRPFERVVLPMPTTPPSKQQREASPAAQPSGSARR